MCIFCRKWPSWQENHSAKKTTRVTVGTRRSGLFSGPRTLNAHWCSALGAEEGGEEGFQWGRRGEWQPYAGPLTHLPSWHTNPSHWFSAQRICSSAWPRMPLGHKMLSDFFVFFPETNTLTLDGCWRAKALDEIENRVAPPFPIRIWQLLL